MGLGTPPMGLGTLCCRVVCANDGALTHVRAKDVTPSQESATAIASDGESRWYMATTMKGKLAMTLCRSFVATTSLASRGQQNDTHGTRFAQE